MQRCCEYDDGMIHEYMIHDPALCRPYEGPECSVAANTLYRGRALVYFSDQTHSEIFASALAAEVSSANVREHIVIKSKEVQKYGAVS